MLEKTEPGQNSGAEGPAPASEQAGGTVGNQAGRFIVVGISATAIHFVIMALAIHQFGVSQMALATILGTCAGIIVAYLGHHRFTFGADGQHGPRFGLFLLVYAVVMALHAGLMYLLGDRLGLPYALPFAIATVIAASLTFFLNRQLVFRRV